MFHAVSAMGLNLLGQQLAADRRMCGPGTGLTRPVSMQWHGGMLFPAARLPSQMLGHAMPQYKPWSSPYVLRRFYLYEEPARSNTAADALPGRDGVTDPNGNVRLLAFLSSTCSYRKGVVLTSEGLLLFGQLHN